MFGIVRSNAIYLEGEKTSAFNLAHGRLVFLGACFIAAYVFMAVRAFDLTVIQGDTVLSELVDVGIESTQDDIAENENDTAAVSVALRGDIVDRNGVLLATTIEAPSLYADSPYISDPQNAAEKLVRIFPSLSFETTLKRLKSGRRFVWIERGLTPQQQQQVLLIGEPGLKFKEEPKRLYPQGPLLAHFIGYTNIDGKGQAGVERYFNDVLYRSDNTPLILSLDVRLQYVVRKAVMSAMQKFEAIGGAGIVMDVKTGEILAATSLPDFDPHNAGNAAPDHIFNRLTLGVYELGSVFKIFSTAAFLESKQGAISTNFDVREPIKYGRFTINDYHPEDRVLSLPEVFMLSSNIGSAMMGERLGTEVLRSFYETLGVLTPLNLEIGEIGAPLVPSPWRDINTLTATYGHGVATTPIQLVAGVSSVVNGGLLVKPTLLRTDPDMIDPVQVVSSDTSEKMRQLLRLVVMEGTGKNADVKGFKVGGKTGTAEKPGGGKYDQKKRISSFVGVFPTDNPQYAVYVVIDEPRGQKETYGYATGGWVAAPAVASIVRSMAPILGLVPDLAGERGDPANALKPYIHEASYD